MAIKISLFRHHTRVETVVEMDYGHEIPSQLKLDAKCGMLHFRGNIWGIKHVVNKPTPYTNEVNGNTAIYCQPPPSAMNSFRKLLHTPVYYVYEVHEIGNPVHVKQYIKGKVKIDQLDYDICNDKKRSRCTIEPLDKDECSTIFEEMKRQKCSEPSRFVDSNKKSTLTAYKGCTYRSRLEATHALQMDLMGVEQSYEGCEWTLDDGSRYSPDFYLKTHGPRGTYLEIKPKRPADDAMLKCQGLCRKTGQCVILFFGKGFGPPFVASDKDRAYKHSDNYIGIRFSYDQETKEVKIDHDVTWMYNSTSERFIIDKRIAFDDNRHLHPKLLDTWKRVNETSTNLLQDAE